MKYLIVVIIFFSLLVTLIFDVRKRVSVVFCDVGQGDATLVIAGAVQLVIDVGRDKEILPCLSKFMPLFDSTIEYLLLTHSDQDHIGGLEDVFSTYKIQEIILPADISFYDDFDAYKELIQRQMGVENMVSVFDIRSLTLEQNLEVKIISPERVFREKVNYNSLKYETTLSDITGEKRMSDLSKNNLSTGIYLVFKDTKIALFGDAEIEYELALHNSGLLAKANVLKVSHHGSKTSSSEQFLRSVSPETSIVSVGINNQYNHPFPQVIDRLISLGSSIYRTDQDGTIHLNLIDKSYELLKN